MFKKIILSSAFLALSGCASIEMSDAGVRQGMSAFQEAFNRQDSASLAMAYAEDARLMPSNVPMLAGRAGIQSFWQARFNQGLSHIEKTPIEIQMLGLTAIEMSRYVVTVGERKVQGKDILVWRQGTDGKWRIVADIWNNDHPL